MVASARRAGLGSWWKRHFLGAEALLALILTLGFVVWLELFHGYAVVNAILEGRRGLLYSTLAVVEATLLGFVLATTALVLGFAESPRLELLRDSSQYATLWRTFTASIRAFGLGTVASLAALLLDRDAPAVNNPAMALVVGTTLLAGFRSLRTGWALQSVIEIITKRGSTGD